MKPRRVIEDVVVPAVIVAPYPLTVSQRNCLECFGLTRADYLRLVGRGAFSVKTEGKLRIALFEDVKAYLTTGASPRGGGPKPPAKAKGDRLADFDPEAALRKAGFRLR